MKTNKQKHWLVSASLGAFAFGLVPFAKAELVYEGALAPQPVLVQPAVSASDQVRRARVQAELQNEDILQKRMEELRLRDEQRRTQELMVQGSGNPYEVAAQPQMIVATQAAPVAVAPVAAAPIATQVIATVEPPKEESLKLTISPRGGVSMPSVENSKLNSKYSVGLGVGAQATEHVGVELGYTYSEYGVSQSSYYNPYVLGYQYSTGNYKSNYESMALKQNLFDALLKVYVAGQDSKIRPFIAGGGAYGASFLNYNSQILEYFKRYNITGLSQDYELNQFMGVISGGLDLQLTKNLSIGAQFKYYAVLSARETQKTPAYPTASYGYGYGYSTYSPYSYAGYGANADYDKTSVGNSISKTGYYSVLGGLTLSF